MTDFRIILLLMDTARDIILSLVTGVVSSSLVVIYFEWQQNKRHVLSRGHILERFSGQLFKILTTVRVSLKLKLSKYSFQNKAEVIRNLEEILSRENPGVLMSKLPELAPDQHVYILGQLLQVRDSLAVLFSDSIGHRTVEDKVAASIAEMQGWIDAVLQNYELFPELLEARFDSRMWAMFAASVANLVENCFSILLSTVNEQKISEGLLRWGSRSK